MSSSAEVGGCGVTTRLLFLGWAATVLTLVGAFLSGLTVAALVAAVHLGTGFNNSPPRMTWHLPSPRSVCWAEGKARYLSGATGLLVAVLFRFCSGALFANAAFASFHFTQTRYFAVWLPQQ
jgi:hypothetical protein